MASFHHQLKSGKKGSATRHSTYIARLGAYASRGDLIHSEHANLPAWAGNDPLVFWHAADMNERRNGAVYREHEIALPAELPTPALIELSRAMAEELAGGKPRQIAVHSNTACLGNVPNPHLHLMVSDRLPDGIARTPDRTFARYNAACPENGGCRKDSGGRSRLEVRDRLIAQRKRIAEIQNEFLAAYGFSARVDHRSNREQRVGGRATPRLPWAKVRSLSNARPDAVAAARLAE